MSKTILAIGEIVGGLALALASGPIGIGIFVSATLCNTMIAVGLTTSLAGFIGLFNDITPTAVAGGQTLQTSISPWRFIYGTLGVSGILTFEEFPQGGGTFQNPDTGHQYLHQVITIAAHQITSFNTVLIDDATYTFGGSASQTLQETNGYWVPHAGSPYAGYLFFEFDLGNPANTAQPFPQLAANSHQWDQPGQGTCLQRGRAKVHVWYRYNAPLAENPGGAFVPFSGGRLPKLVFIVTGKPILDTRTNTPATGQALSNSALCVYDFLTTPAAAGGMGADPSTIDLDALNAAANICDEQVTLQYVNQTEPRYSTNGMWESTSTRGQVLKALCDAMAGYVVAPGDLWRVYAGAFAGASILLTDDDLRDKIKGDFRLSARDVCNGVRGKFLPAFIPVVIPNSPPALYQLTDFPPFQSATYLAEDGGQVIWKDVTLSFCTSLWLAQRLAKIILMRLRFQQTITLPCKLVALRLQAGDTVQFSHPRWFGAGLGTFLVTGLTLVQAIENGVPTLGVDLVLRQTDPSVYSFTYPNGSNGYGDYSPYGATGIE